MGAWNVEDWAAVIQAGGVIVGIGLAIAVPWGQHFATSRAEKARANLEAQGMALLIGPDMVVLRDELRVIEKTPLAAKHIEISDSITNVLDRLWVLKRAGGDVLMAVALVRKLQRDIRKWESPNVFTTDAERAEIEPKLHETYALALHRCSEACDQISKIVRTQGGIGGID